jgi:hypothetical protein
VADSENSQKSYRKLLGSIASLPPARAEGDDLRILEHFAVANEMIAKPLFAVKILF